MKRWKSCCALLLLLAVLLSLCACGSSEEPAATEPSAEEPAPLIWRTDSQAVYPFEAGCQVRLIAKAGSTMMVAGSGEGGPVLALADFTLDEEGEVTLGSSRSAELDDPSAPDEFAVYGLCGKKDGSFYLLTGEAPPTVRDAETGLFAVNNPDFSGLYRLLRYDSAGRFLESLAFTWDPGDGTTLCSLACLENGFALCGPSGYLFLDAEGNVNASAMLEDIQLSCVQLCDQGVYAVGYDYAPDSNGPCALELSADGSYQELPFPELNRSVCLNSEGRFLLNDGVGISSYDFAAMELTRLVDWADADQFRIVCQLGDRSFACATRSSDSLVLLSGRSQEREERQIVRVAVSSLLYMAPSDLAEMNNSGSPYYYEYTTFDPTVPGEVDRLLTEIIAGDGPDLVLADAGLNFDGLDTGSAAFEDLYPYLDAEEGLNREDFLPGYFAALEVNGELHELWPFVAISTLAIRASDADKAENFRPAELMRILEQSEQRLYPIYSQTPDRLLSSLANDSAGAFVDRNEAVCHFDDPAFAEMLAWCLDMPDISVWVSGDGEDSSLSLTSMETVNLMRLAGLEEYFMHEPFVYIGYPTPDGNGHFFYPSRYSASIPSASKNKEGAWAFIRAQLTMEKQTAIEQMGDDRLPVLYEALERVVADRERAGLMDDRDAELLFDLVEHTNKALSANDAPLREIIRSAGRAYLAGDKSLEDTVALIQSRATIYIQEKYGW